jgi:hypothetical protein
MGDGVRVFLNCFECQKSHGGLYIAIAEYNNSGVFNLTCSKGHKSVTVIQQNRSEILFEIACHAINDGYYREAVTSFAASLERFYEYAIRVILRHANTSPETFKVAWKEVSKQSERQLGAFVLLWSAFLGDMPTILKSERVKFRNDVVHNGLIPTREEAISFGEQIHQVIQPLKARLSKEMPDACQQVLVNMLLELRPKGYQGHVAAGWMNVFLSDEPNKELRAHLKSLKGHVAMMEQLSVALNEGSLSS